MELKFQLENNIATEEFIDVLRRSTLAELRPVDDVATMEMMIRHADVIVTARCGELLVGVSRRSPTLPTARTCPTCRLTWNFKSRGSVES
jgi:hypothetical protein